MLESRPISRSCNSFESDIHTPFEFIGGQEFLVAEHAQAEEPGEPSQILSSHHQHPRPHIPGKANRISFTTKNE